MVTDPRRATFFGRAVDWLGLDSAIDFVLRPRKVGTRPVGLLFSGGVDSSLLAWELRDVPRLALLTVGLAGSRDLDAGRVVAQQLALPWTGIEIDRLEVHEVARGIYSELNGLSAVDRSVQTSLAVALARAPRIPLLCGQGVDELFGGYSHFRGLPPDVAARRSEEDLEKLLSRDWPLTLRIAGKLGHSLEAPYLNAQFLAAVRQVPPADRLDPTVPKAFFRAWAVHRGLPEALAARPKRAMQYGSGIDRILRQQG